MAQAAILGFLFLALGLFCGLDPFKTGAMVRFPDFEVYPVEQPPWSEIPRHQDPENLLQKSEQRFLGQVQGPESVTFDSEGRGPYVGVADGRVLFWNGTSWTDFAYTSPNRLTKLFFFFSFRICIFFGHEVSTSSKVILIDSCLTLLNVYIFMGLSCWLVRRLFRRDSSFSLLKIYK